MTPAEAQQAALDQLEHLGGKPVVLQAKEQLSNQAKISLASSTQPAHVLTYHPAFVHELPYLNLFPVCDGRADAQGSSGRTVQCGQHSRHVPAGSEAGWQKAANLFSRKKTGQLL